MRGQGARRVAMAAEAAPMMATLGHQLVFGPAPPAAGAGSGSPRVIELAAVAPRPRAPAGGAGEKGWKTCETGFQLAFPVGQHGDGQDPPPQTRAAGAHAAHQEYAAAAAAEAAEADAEAGEAGDGKDREAPRPKFVVLPPDFAGQCACELRVLPRCPCTGESRGAVDGAQDLYLLRWRQASEVTYVPMLTVPPLAADACLSADAAAAASTGASAASACAQSEWVRVDGRGADCRACLQGPLCPWRPRVFLASLGMFFLVLGAFLAMAYFMNGAKRTWRQEANATGKRPRQSVARPVLRVCASCYAAEPAQAPAWAVMLACAGTCARVSPCARGQRAIAKPALAVPASVSVRVSLPPIVCRRHPDQATGNGLGQWQG